MIEPRLLSPDQAAAYLGLGSRWAIYRLVKSGQLVSVTLTQGAIQAKSVARAMEQGTIGQTIRVRNEATNNQPAVGRFSSIHSK